MPSATDSVSYSQPEGKPRGMAREKLCSNYILADKTDYKSTDIHGKATFRFMFFLVTGVVMSCRPAVEKPGPEGRCGLSGAVPR